MSKRKQDGKRTRKRMAAEPQQERCIRCRAWMPVGHVCPSANKANEARGNRAVFAVRMPRLMRTKLDALAAQRMAAKSWPRTSAASLVLEAVQQLLQREGLA